MGEAERQSWDQESRRRFQERQGSFSDECRCQEEAVGVDEGALGREEKSVVAGRYQGTSLGAVMRLRSGGDWFNTSQTGISPGCEPSQFQLCGFETLHDWAFAGKPQSAGQHDGSTAHKDLHGEQKGNVGKHMFNRRRSLAGCSFGAQPTQALRRDLPPDRQCPRLPPKS